MKKLSSRILTLCLTFLLGVMTPIAIAAGIVANPSTTKIMVDGKEAAITGYAIADNNYFKLRDMCELLGASITYDAQTKTANITSGQIQQTASTKLMQGNWAPETCDAIQAVIDANANKGKYVVFDFDNTSVINDVEEALLVYQIENLAFEIKPENLYNVLKTQLPDMNKVVGQNDASRDVTCEQLAQDITADYKILYNTYKGFGAGGTKELAAIHETTEYKDFAAKLRYMYTAIGDTFDASVSYPWVTYLFAGMNAEEVYELANNSHRYWSSYGKFTEESWTSPDQGTAGQITATYLTGITFTEELQNLYQTLMANRIDVYIVSASFIDVIRAAARDPYFGYNVPEEQIFAMQLKKDANGNYIAEYDYDFGGTGKYAQTQAEGKSTIIKNFIQPKYNGAGPLMVFGDSAGDYNMMTDFDDTALGVIFNRYRKTSDPIWKCCMEASKTIGQPNPRYVLQGRDNNIGQLIPTQYSRMLGSQDLVLVRSLK